MRQHLPDGFAVWSSHINGDMRNPVTIHDLKRRHYDNMVL